MSVDEGVAVACCVAMALVVAWVREGWFRLFPSRRPVTAAFAPPARRPAPTPAGPRPSAGAPGRS